MLTPIITGMLTGAVGAAAYFSPYIIRMAEEARLRKCCREQQTLVLTYDDGPGENLTPRLLELLDTYQVSATFFLLGMRVQESPGFVARIAEAGHELGCHGQYHLNAWKAWPWQVLNDIRAGYRTLGNAVGAHCSPFRPPYGKLVLPTWWALRGTPIGWWTVDSGDTHAQLPQSDDVVKQVKSAGGGVVLLHDFDRQGNQAAVRADFVLDTTAALLEAALVENWKVQPLGRLLH
ncbi:MAG: polysaccharide deacetylase family protein [Pseudomonadota bacterium]